MSSIVKDLSYTAIIVIVKSCQKSSFLSFVVKAVVVHITLFNGKAFNFSAKNPDASIFVEKKILNGFFFLWDDSRKILPLPFLMAACTTTITRSIQEHARIEPIL